LVAGEGDGADDGEEGDGALPSLPFTRYSTIMAMEINPPRWLIRDIWTAGSHGIWGGEPKTSKTTLGLALGLAVASGRPFLGKYRVDTSGPVLMVQEENSLVDVQDKLRKLANHAGLLGDFDATPAGRGSLGKHTITIKFPEDVPLRMLNNHGLDLTDSEHRYMLEREIQATRPKLVILDPLYLLMPTVDINRSDEVSFYLRYLLHLRNSYDCAIILVHHQHKFNESSKGRVRGQRLMGSALFHGWSDSAIYTSVVPSSQPGWLSVQMGREFRTMPPQEDLLIDLHLGKPGDIEQFRVRISQKGVIDDLIYRAVEEAGEYATAHALARDLHLKWNEVWGRAKDMGLKTWEGEKWGSKVYYMSVNGRK
jgi:hypothetical protein